MDSSIMQIFCKTLLLLLCLTIASSLASQSRFDYQFTGCQLTDSSGTLPNMTSSEMEECRCGVVDDGIYCNGSSLYYNLPSEVMSLFESPSYTFQFYFLPEDQSQVQALFSIMSTCSRDSMLALQYIPQDNQVEILISRNIGDSWTTRGDLNRNQCWHSVAVTKDNSLYSLYVDDKFIESFDNIDPFPISPNSLVYVGYSPCVADGSDNTFRGVIDNLQFVPNLLSANDLTNNGISPDQIISRDTTIAIGQSVDILSGPTCSLSAIWSPTDGIDDINALEPTITPSVSTTFTRTLSHSGCTTTDSIRINTFDPADLDCAELLMPNVFTPNNDNINDDYEISNGFIIEELVSFEVFDRWGAKIFYTDSKEVGWQGNINGSPALSGMYVYKIVYFCNSSEYEKYGSFSLMR